MILKLLGTETTLSAPSTVNDATLVRLLNTTATNVLVTIKDAATSSVIGTFTILPNVEHFIQKKYTDTITGNGLLCVQVAYTSG